MGMEIAGAAPSVVVELGRVVPSPRTATSEPFAQALHGVARAVDRGEALLAGASHLRDYDAATLIALQAGIYRYSEAVELVAKIVDHASAAARTVLQGSNH
jgi:hypothetical protein